MDKDVANSYKTKGGKVPESWWVIGIASRSKKRIYRLYPTHKPLKLLERIIRASSNEGDVVLDFLRMCNNLHSGRET